jgi:transcriptional regulator with XRE-family HTH domain
MPLADVDKFYTDLGERIKTERLKRNIKQETLGNYLGLTRTSVINLEKGRHRASIFQLLQIAELFQIDYTLLVPPFSPKPIKKSKRLIKDLDNIITDQAKVDKGTKTAVLDFLTAINKE